jgi:AraC-like DNA-binding protein
VTVYNPVKDGVAKKVTSVVYAEVAPPPSLRHVVHCFWEMRTVVSLEHDFTLHALPDACVNLLFNQLDPRIAGVTLLHTEPIALNLGRTFHYAGIQLFPGVWRGAPEASVDHFVGEPYGGDLPLVEASTAAATMSLDGKVAVFTDLVSRLMEIDLIVENPVTAAILLNLDRIRSVRDMAEVASLSPRQLQRAVKATTGFTPHDLWKVLRLQHSFRSDYQLMFADQSHFTHSFRDLTGFTPAEFKKSFNV